MTTTGNPHQIESREFVESKDYANYKNVAGTGPFMVTDFITGNSITYSKNPDYYLNDERYPDNPIPYLDGYRLLYITDQSTWIAALRSGQVDITIMTPAEVVDNLKKTNPELLFTTGTSQGMGLDMREDVEPFNDIRVRKALQLAIDFPTIAKELYGGGLGTDPSPYLCPWITSYVVPYEEWPEDLQQEYVYNPERARQLLADAGYPEGFDTNVIASTAFWDDSNLLQLVKDYFAKINVNMEIKNMDLNQKTPFIRAGKADQMYATTGSWKIGPVDMSFLQRTSTYIDNQIYAPAEDLYEEFLASRDEATAKVLARQMAEYIYRHHWSIILPPKVGFTTWNSRLQGYNGEDIAQTGRPVFFARLWLK
jgi:peptide/nickel transport system substrate-binding protein